MKSYYVNHLFAPLPAGYVVEPHQWPMHLTLLGNFVTDLSSEQVVNQVETVVAETHAVRTTAMREAWFGPAGEFHVITLTPVPELLAMHTKLAVAFAGAVFDQPQYLGESYQPHVTVKTDGQLALGKEVLVDSVSLFEIDRVADRRVLLNTWQLH